MAMYIGGTHRSRSQEFFGKGSFGSMTLQFALISMLLELLETLK